MLAGCALHRLWILSHSSKIVCLLQTSTKMVLPQKFLLSGFGFKEGKPIHKCAYMHLFVIL